MLAPPALFAAEPPRFSFDAPPGPQFSEAEKRTQRDKGTVVVPPVRKAFEAGDYQRLLIQSVPGTVRNCLFARQGCGSHGLTVIGVPPFVYAGAGAADRLERGFGAGTHTLLPFASPITGRGLMVCVVSGSKQSVAVPRNSAMSSFRTAGSSANTVIQMLKNPWPAAVRAI